MWETRHHILGGKEVFDVLELVGVGAEGGGESLEQQVLKISGAEDMEKPRALAKLCSKEFFDDPSLLVTFVNKW